MEAAGFVYMRRRPWNEKDSAMTTMVNDVAWVSDEENDENQTTGFSVLN